MSESQTKGARTILVIEDDAGIRRGLTRILRRAGWVVRTAENGLEGLERVAEEQPSVILLDLEMPMLDGARFLGMLEVDPVLASIPVIRMSGRAWPSIGPPVLPKPFGAEELIAVLAGLGFPERAG